ncbi:secreted protein [Beggiatoa sp. PS]|nr:secreted protein [Beggiatoa sp. PS]
MKSLVWIFITLLLLNLSGCASVEAWVAKMDEKTYNRYTNQALVKWYRNQFLPKMDALRKSSPYEMYVVDKVKQTFLGVKINYTEEINYNYHAHYAHVHNNALNWYQQYVQQRGGSIQAYKPALAKAIVRVDDLRMIDDDNMRGCYFEKTYFAKVNNRLDSAFIDVTCYYPAPMITGGDVNSTFGWIAVLEAPVLRRALDRLPNSLLMETQINY